MALELALAGLVSAVAGLDRTALLQIMLCRPLVAAPLTGWLLGIPEIGLQVGCMCELLWLGRLPVGAAIPPDDTQVSIAATALAAVSRLSVAGPDQLPLALVCLLLALPLGKAAQLFDRLARQRNLRLVQRWDQELAAANLKALDGLHLRGLLHFTASSLAGFIVIFAGGWPLLHWFGPWLLEHLAPMAEWLRLGLIMVGVAAILATLHVSRALTLFSAAFLLALLLLWVS